MALRFFDGFDHYPLADLTLKWTSQGNAGSMSTSTTRFSYGQSMQFASGGSGNLTKIIDSQTTWILGSAFRFTNFTTAGAILQIKNGSNIVGFLSVSTAGKLALVSENSGGGGTTTLATGTTTLSLNTWYWIEFKYTCASTSGAVSASCKIGGVTECSQVGSSGGTSTNGTSADTVQVLNPTTAQTNVDDFYACDGTGSNNNDFLGDSRVETLRPNGAGYSTQFSHTGGSSNWQSVDETTEDGDSTYVSDATAGDIDSYTVGDLSTTPSSIFGVQTTMVLRKDDAGSRTVNNLVRISSTNYLGSNVTVTDSYSFSIRIMETSPATSVLWTSTEVNGLEMGIKLVS
jgi:hypothetical protein